VRRGSDLWLLATHRDVSTEVSAFAVFSSLDRFSGSFPFISFLKAALGAINPVASFLLI
jgi:hypothetical protein